MLQCASIGLGWWGGEHAAATQGKSNLLRIEACHTDSGDRAADAAAMRDFADRYDARPFARFDELREGQTVEYEAGQGPKGPRAEKVRPV